MADEFQNWWDSSSRNITNNRSSRNRFESGSSPTSSSALNNIGGGSFGWPTEIVDTTKALIRPSSSSIDSMSLSGSSSVVYQDGTQKMHTPDSGSGSLLVDPSLQMMGLGLSSQGIDWNQTLLRSEKAESSFRTMLQDDVSSSNASFQQETPMVSSQDHWRQKLYGGATSEDSEYKQINRGSSLDQHQFSTSHLSPGENSTVTCQTLPTGFQMDSYGSPTTMLQGLLGGSDNNQQPQQSTFQNRSMNYPSYPSGYGLNTGGGDALTPPWPKFPQCLRASPPHPLKQPSPSPHSQLQFSNNAPFWNASAAAMNDVQANFLPTLQMQLPSSTFDGKPKRNNSEVRDMVTVGPKKSNSNSNEPSTKRPRNETPSPLPAFKVRKEKMGDRITALQQLVSPFGKTDTASVLSEAIEYIKFLHAQVNVLSTPYMKNGVPIQPQQNSDKSNDPEGPKQDLKSRGLCLVPVSSTFPVTHETTVDFWTPTFGGTFR